MPRLFRKLFKKVFGIQENMIIKLNLSCIIASIVFTMFAYIHNSIYGNETYYSIIAGVLFAIWIILIKGVDTLDAVAWETVRLMLFLVIFTVSLNCSAQYIFQNNISSPIEVILAAMGMIICIFYLVCKMVDIFDFIKKIVTQIRAKLFNTENAPTSKVKAVIENITAFFVSVGGLAIAILTIMETMLKIIKIGSN